MLRFNKRVAAITAGTVALVGFQAYGFYSTRRSFDARLNQIENKIESFRVADSARILKNGNNPKRSKNVGPAITQKRPSSNRKNKDAVVTVGDRIARNPSLAAKLQKMLPAGMNLRRSASGFKNERQFITAVHVSNNLGIPFTQLKAKITGDHSMSVEKAIRELRPRLSKARVKAEVEKAQRQAGETEKLGRTT